MSLNLELFKNVNIFWGPPIPLLGVLALDHAEGFATPWLHDTESTHDRFARMSAAAAAPKRDVAQKG